MTFVETSQEFRKPRLLVQQNPIRLRTLVRLRWLAVAGQLIAIFAVSVVLGFNTPLLPCLVVVGTSALFNIGLSVRYRSGEMLSSRAAGLQLAYDIGQLAVLLYLTGGLQNPFAFLFLVPVTVSASSLPLRWTLGLGAEAFVAVTLLWAFHQPLPWQPGEIFNLPTIYTAGMWVAVLCGTSFAALFAARIAEEANIMSAALGATELVLAREQRLSALDGLAAAAAHELGTPLATIALVAKELKREVPSKSPHAEDIDLLISQAARCREILARLSSHETADDEIFGQMKVSSMLEDLAAPLRGAGVTIELDCQPDDGTSLPAEPVYLRNPAISYGLENILANAIDFASSRVAVKARWNSSSVIITIQDDGPGFDEAIFDRLGDPYVTTRPGYDGREDEKAGQDEVAGHEGMGLGLFISKTLLERSGAGVAMGNVANPNTGAIVRLTWPRHVIDLGLQDGKSVDKPLDPKAAGLH